MKTATQLENGLSERAQDMAIVLKTLELRRKPLYKGEAQDMSKGDVFQISGQTDNVGKWETLSVYNDYAFTIVRARNIESGIVRVMKFLQTATF